YVRPSGWSLLNGDDVQLYRLAEARISAKKFSSRLGFIALGESFIEKATAHWAGMGIPVMRATDLQTSAMGTQFTVCYHQDCGAPAERLGQITLRVPGRHHVRNALFGLMCAQLMDVPFSSAAAGLADYRPTGSRQRIVSVDEVTVIDDSYNASEESMLAAFELATTLLQGTNGRFLAALGGINELGPYSSSIHERIGRALWSYRPTAIFLIGEATEALAIGYRTAQRETVENSLNLPQESCLLPAHPFPETAEGGGGNRRAEPSAGVEAGDQCAELGGGGDARNQSAEIRHFKDTVALSEAIKTYLQPGDVLLVKGSHSFGMALISEDVISFLNTAYETKWVES
ncbi:MAG TPA: hypothetical protein GX717_00660, partial [Clostridiaceae bacterium]|nr:hypothetical protein [Clostridiaceae bacterium]